MKKRILFVMVALLTMIASGCNKPGGVLPEVPITGGKVDHTDYNAPKEIKSRELTSFSYKFFLYGKYNYEKDNGYDIEVMKNEDGSVTVEERSCYKVKCTTDARILSDLQAIIDKYQLAKLNGVDKHTAGLPPEFQPCYFNAEYASGESIYFSQNNNPDDPCAREVLKLIGDEFAAHGEECFLPPVSASEISRFELDFTDGTTRYHYGELHVPKDGVEKSFEELVEHGYEDGEYYVVIERDPWDRTGKTEPESTYREVTPEYYEGLKKVLNEIRIIDYVNDEQYPSEFDYEGTPEYYNFYIEYEYGNNLYGFSDDPEDNKTFAPAAKAIAEYIENYINEGPQSDMLHLIQTNISRGISVDAGSGLGAYVDYPAFALTQADSLKYRELDNALYTLGKKYEEEYSKHLDTSHEYAEAALADGSEMHARFFDSLFPEIRRADSHIVSIFESYESYTGGVHGYYAYYGDNFDTATGKELMLSDVITDATAFRETVTEKLYAHYPEMELVNLDEALKDLATGDNSDTPWTMDYSGVTLYFNPYHLASYADGMQVITVPFNENPKMFRPEYLEVPDAYVQQLNGNAPAILDVDGDGINEAIFIDEGSTAQEGDDEYSNNYAEWTVSCGDRSVTISDGCYRGDFYLVRANGQYYIYIFEVSDNDYSLCNVIDLNRMTNDSSKIINACMAGLDSSYEYTENGFKSVRSEYIFTDPASFELSSRIEVLSSGSGMKNYHVGSDGWPVSDDEFFSVASSIVLTAKRDVSCKEVGEDGAVKSDAVLKNGTRCVVVRTDNETWADVQEVDESELDKESSGPFLYTKKAARLRAGRAIYRIPYSTAGWPHTVDGADENEVFDGIMYAG